MTIIETERLTIRRLTTDDAPFILELLNEPSFVRFIGDKGVRDLAAACEYLMKGPIDSYARNGFGLYHVSLRDEGPAIGICGLLKRDTLEHPDIGFAFLPAYWSKGYAFEAGSAVLGYGRTALRLGRILAITDPDNHSSIALLQRLGLTRKGMVRIPPEDRDVSLFQLEAADGGDPGSTFTVPPGH